MEHEHLSSKSLARTTETGRTITIARLISQLFHPMLLAILDIYIVGLFNSHRWLDGLGWATLAMILFVAPPAIFFTVRLHQGIYSDEDVSIRHQRNELYFFSFGTIALGTGVLVLLDAPTAFFGLLMSVALMNLFGWVINLFWKISVHATSAAACATVAMIYSQPLGMLLWIAALMVGWARVYTRNHTVLQVLAGFALASFSVLFAFSAFDLL